MSIEDVGSFIMKRVFFVNDINNLKGISSEKIVPNILLYFFSFFVLLFFLLLGVLTLSSTIDESDYFVASILSLFFVVNKELIRVRKIWDLKN